MKKIFAWLLVFAFLTGVCAFAEGGLRADAEETAFEAPNPAPAPSAEAFAEKYFSVLASAETDTAGASLKTAAAAEKVCAFAAEYELWNPDVNALRTNMLAAFESLNAADQEAALAGFEAVRALLDECLVDWEGSRPLFEDAGAAEAMDAVMYDPLNRLAWENLRDHTLTMGNDPGTEDEVSFETLSGLEWCFSSGAGAWSTELTIHADGSFSGVYHDSEMGDADDAYPDGTVYICTFSGQMSFGETPDAHTREIRIDRLTQEGKPDEENIADGIRYITSEPYGLSEGDTMLLYLPGTPSDALTEDMQMWAHLFEAETMPEKLENYFLYSAANQSGFVGAFPIEAGMANPWTEMTSDALLLVSGVPFALPEEAENVICRWLESERLAEVQYTLDGNEYCFRSQPAALQAGELANISGMYFAWEQEQSVQIAHCEGTLSTAKTGSSEWVENCLWYDAAPGIMYSLSVYTLNPENVDLPAAAGRIFCPAQGE